MARIRSVLPALVLAACATASSLVPGTSTESDVRAALGPPALELPVSGGGRQLAFPRGPQGTETHMVFLRKDGVVDHVAQVLNDDSFARIRGGVTTGDEVLRLIGPPRRKIRFDNLSQDAWEYRYRDSWGYLADFSVMIDGAGVVASKIAVRIDPSDRSK